MGFYVRVTVHSTIDMFGLCNALNKYSWADQYGRWETDGEDVSWCPDSDVVDPKSVINHMPAIPTKWYERTDSRVVEAVDPLLKCGDINYCSEIYFDPKECVAVSLELISKDFSPHVIKGKIEFITYREFDDDKCQYAMISFDAEEQRTKIGMHIGPLPK
jgi:hypothetical protein